MAEDICLIDDNPIFLFMAKKMLQLQNCCEKVSIFPNGLEAINSLVKKHKEGEKLPDVILLDINMPVMDGWEFLEAYEKASLPCAKIYLVTSSVDPADIEKSKNYDLLQGYITKPLTVTDISKIIS